MSATNRRWFTAAAATLLVTAAADSFAQGVSIHVDGRWKAGDEVRYERVKSRTDSAAATPFVTYTPVTIQVIETSPMRHLLRWRDGRSRTEGVPAAASALVEQLQERFANFEYVIELDRMGAITALRNWEAVRDAAFAAMDAAAAAPGGASGAAAQPDAVAQVRALFSSRESVERYLLREVQLFFMLYGWRLDPGEKTSYEDQLPNPLGGPALPATATIELASADRQRATLRYTLDFDRDKAGRLLADSLAALAARSGIAASGVEAVAKSLQVRDTAELTFDLQARWPARLVHERNIRIQDRSRVDRLSFERQP